MSQDDLDFLDDEAIRSSLNTHSTAENRATLPANMELRLKVTIKPNYLYTTWLKWHTLQTDWI